MYIMTDEGWKLLKPPVSHEVWELVVWDDKEKKHIKDTGPLAILQHIGWSDYIPEAPPIYRGALPSPEFKAYVRRIDGFHNEWIERRKALID